MEAPTVQNIVPLSEMQKISQTLNNTSKNEVKVENENYICSNKSEYDGYTSNEDAYYQSSCDEIVNNEENFETSKDEGKLQKPTTDNKNSTESKIEKLNTSTTEPLLIEEEKELQHSEDKSVNNVKNSITRLPNKNSTPLLRKKKSNKKLSKFPKHKQSYVRIYLKFKDKLHNKTKTKSKSKSEIKTQTQSQSKPKPKPKSKSISSQSMINPIETPIQNVSSYPASNTSHDIRNNNNDPRLCCSLNDITQLNEKDIREITVINVDGESMLLPTRKRTTSLSYPKGSNIKRKSSEKTDSTITPKKIKKDSSFIQNVKNFITSKKEPKEKEYSVIVSKSIDDSINNVNAERPQVDLKDNTVGKEEKSETSSSLVDVGKKENSIVDVNVEKKMIIENEKDTKGKEITTDLKEEINKDDEDANVASIKIQSDNQTVVSLPQQNDSNEDIITIPPTNNDNEDNILILTKNDKQDVVLIPTTNDNHQDEVSTPTNDNHQDEVSTPTNDNHQDEVSTPTNDNHQDEVSTPANDSHQDEMFTSTKDYHQDPTQDDNQEIVPTTAITTTTINESIQDIIPTTIIANENDVIMNNSDENEEKPVIQTTTEKQEITSPVLQPEVKKIITNQPFINTNEKDNTSYVDLSEKKELPNGNTLVVSKENVQDNDFIGAGISMVKPFHPDNDISTHIVDETTKTIDLPIMKENVYSTPSHESLVEEDNQNLDSTMNEKNLPPLPDLSISGEKKLNIKKKPIKSSLKKYFKRSKKEIPQYVFIEDFEKFKENTQKSIENSRNFEVNTTTINENNEKFKENMKENLELMKGDLLNLNNDCTSENRKLREEIVELQYRLISVRGEKEREIDQLRNEVAEEIIKLQDALESLKNEKEKEIEQLREEIIELRQKESKYQDIIEHHLLNINTTLDKLKEENFTMKDELYGEIHKIKDRKIMETNPDDLVKQNELQTLSEQLVKSNVQWNELSHDVQNLPVQFKKDMDDKFESFEKNQNEKNKDFENFISDSTKTQSNFDTRIKELLKLQKANEDNIEMKTRSINETIALQGQQIQNFEDTRKQMWNQNEKINIIGDRVDHYCTNDYLDTVIELEDLRKITNRTTEELFNLQKLNLYCKNLDRLPKRIYSLENLNELWLGRNNLNNINDKIGNLKNLKRLSIADNNLSQLPVGIKNLKNLTHLYLYKNKLKELPPEIGDLESLIHLDVESNKLTKLPKELKNLKNLENLDIENNLFNEFPAIIFELKKLVKLNLSSNKFFFIPRELENLTNLKLLNLKDNYLRSFPYSILKFTNLEELDLSNNLFKDIPSEIRYLEKLKSLNLANVRIDEIIPEIGCLRELKILNLSNCNIRILPNCLKNLQYLEEINLSNNDGIVILPEYFRNFKNLKKVILNKNVVYRNGMEYPRYKGSVYNDLLKKNIIKTE